MLRLSGEAAVFARKPRAIIFDTDNTLYAYQPSHRAAMSAIRSKAAELLGLKEAAFDAAFDEARSQIKTQLGHSASSHSRLLYLQRTLELLKLGTQILLTLDLEQTYWRTFLSHSRLFPDVKEFLLDIKSDGVASAIITDLTAQIQFRKIVYFGLDNHFDYVVTSEEAGQDKPHSAPFALTIKKLGLAPEDLWMIGDDPIADIFGARQHGILTLQKIHEGVKHHDDGPAAPHMQFREFAELRRLWRSLPAHSPASAPPVAT
jgi:HAD superfamily hydrolase (TIGR01549 family)